MDEMDFQNFMGHIVSSYAKDMISSGFLDESEAIERAKSQMNALLPDGLKTKGHKFTFIVDDGIKVGYLWFEIRQNGEAFIWDIEVFEEKRGKGYGRESLMLLEKYCKDCGVSKISLNVFGNNEIAINLYKKMGYRIVAMLMKKDI